MKILHSSSLRQQPNSHLNKDCMYENKETDRHQNILYQQYYSKNDHSITNNITSDDVFYRSALITNRSETDTFDFLRDTCNYSWNRSNNSGSSSDDSVNCHSRFVAISMLHQQPAPPPSSEGTQAFYWNNDNDDADDDVLHQSGLETASSCYFHSPVSTSSMVSCASLDTDLVDKGKKSSDQRQTLPNINDDDQQCLLRSQCNQRQDKGKGRNKRLSSLDNLYLLEQLSCKHGMGELSQEEVEGCSPRRGNLNDNNQRSASKFSFCEQANLGQVSPAIQSSSVHSQKKNRTKSGYKHIPHKDKPPHLVARR